MLGWHRQTTARRRRDERSSHQTDGATYFMSRRDMVVNTLLGLLLVSALPVFFLVGLGVLKGASLVIASFWPQLAHPQDALLLGFMALGALTAAIQQSRKRRWRSAFLSFAAFDSVDLVRWPSFIVWFQWGVLVRHRLRDFFHSTRFRPDPISIFRCRIRHLCRHGSEHWPFGICAYGADGFRLPPCGILHMVRDVGTRAFKWSQGPRPASTSFSN